jgi:predicted TPR repeat methyltransferase
MSSNTFDYYAEIYDAFYLEKDYVGECKNLIQIAKSLNGNLRVALEVGSGTGALTKELSKKMVHIEAYELSPRMAEICSGNTSDLSNVKVNLGGLTQILNSTVNRGSTDLVVANFHVFSYFTDFEVTQFVEVCNCFLRSGGVVAFDFWDLKAVLSSPPAVVRKVAPHSGKEITRYTKPESRSDSREIKVKFEFYDQSKLLFQETHVMFPRTLDEVKGYFDGDFQFCGSYEIESGAVYSPNKYGNFVFFQKI